MLGYFDEENFNDPRDDRSHNEDDDNCGCYVCRLASRLEKKWAKEIGARSCPDSSGKTNLIPKINDIPSIDFEHKQCFIDMEKLGVSSIPYTTEDTYCESFHGDGMNRDGIPEGEILFR